MKRSDIDKIFTEKVAIYLSMGATISTKTMSGHQGEEGKVDLILGGQLIRIWMEQKTVYNWLDEDDKFSGTMMILRVGIWNKSISEIRDGWTTVWMKDLETIEEIIFYEVGRRGYYVDSLLVALEAQQKHRTRQRNRRIRQVEVHDASDEARAIAYRYLKRVPGYKRVKWDDIVVRKTSKYGQKTDYIINYHGNKYHLH